MWEDLQQQVRGQAEAFIAGELKDEDVINVDEWFEVLFPWLPFGLDACFSLTVWYKTA
ncbi:MAG: hypothetical protein GX605_12070 [Chloroflexi bacterium]|nr:hypothetical protein [Chloroflexota bacterium]